MRCSESFAGQFGDHLQRCELAQFAFVRGRNNEVYSCVEPVKRVMLSANGLIKKIQVPYRQLAIKNKVASNTKKEAKSLYKRMHLDHAILFFKRPRIDSNQHDATTTSCNLTMIQLAL